MKRLIFAVVAFFAAAFALQAQNLLPNDPTVRVGKLDNGLTYYIKYNDKPAQRAEFYLATHVGAIQETPDQDGLAHFLEHMCFNGTKNLPGKTMLDYLQSIGASFGKNINAGTGVEQTTYMLNNIPVVREGIIDTCLLIMHDYSHFVTNDPAEIDAERGVIVEEWRTRRTPEWRMHEKSLPYLYGDSKYATCTLIGSKENLETFKPESLWNFYKTWYRPDLQAVIVVGDVDVDKIEQKIKDLWSDIPAAENPQPKVMPVIPANEKPLVGIITDPEATSTTIQTISRQEPMPSEYNAYDVGMMMNGIKWAISAMFNERFSDITSRPNAPFLSAGAGLGSLCETSDAFFTSMSSREGEALEGFRALMTEVEKVRRYGFTEGEFERAKANILSMYESAAESADTRTNADFVDLYIQNFFQHYPYMDPKQEYEIFKAMASQLNVDMINQMVMGGLLSEDNLSIIYKAPEKEGLVHPTEQQLLDIMAEVKAADIQANVETVSNEPLVDAKALKGSKIKKTEEGVFGTTIWTLKNGIQVVVRPSAEKKDDIRIYLEADGGSSLIATEDLPSFDNTIFSLYLGNAGVSKFSSSDLRKALAGKNVSIDPFIGRRTHGISGSSTKKDFETALQLMYLFAAEPRFVDEDFQVGLEQLRNLLPNIVEQPSYKLQTKVNEVLYGNNPRVPMLSQELLDKADINVIEKNYRMLFGNLKGAKLYIFGDVDLEQIKPLVAKYAGSLPVGKKPLEVVEHNIDIVPGTIEEVFNVKMETPKGTAVMVYNGDMEYTPKAVTVMRYLNNCLDILYTKTIREEEGGTYGVGVMGSLQNSPKEKFVLQVVFDTNPEQAQKLMDKVVAGLKDIAENGPTAEQMQMSRENFLKEIPEDRLSNGWWLNNAKFTIRYGIDEVTNEKEIIESVTAEDVRDMAKAIVSQPNFIDLLMLPEAAE